ncbi:putative sensor protein gacS [Leptodontidium sp. MPI-SDFR-AT-0119]|nr:putative sensor protein gacS [Leptodontidium sp. MPI-SDFR-AT-0119]
MPGCTASKCSISARDREVFRYYLPPSSTTILDQQVGSSKKASSDPTLTAFAQLGCLRINCKRGIITLSTKDTEFVLAEATQELSLQQDNDDTDNLWHGEGALLPGKEGLGAEIRKVFDGPDPPAIFLCPDLAADDRFKDTYPVVNPPHLRGFACVPLITPLHNIHVGNYIVVDDKPRSELTDGEQLFLTDMAATVMDYLEAGRVKRQQYRAERMIKAIGLFIEGKATLREWWLETGHKYQHASLKKRARESTPLDLQADIEFGVQETTDYFSRNGLNGLSNYRSVLSKSPSSVSLSTTDPGERNPIGDGRPPIPRTDTVLSGSDLTPTSVPRESTDGSSQATRRDTVASTVDTAPSTLVSKSYQERNSSVTTFDDTVTDPTPDPEKHNSVQFDLPPEPAVTDESKDLQNAVLSSDVKGVFARASNLIREAIGVEGVIYYDASVGSFGGSSNKEAMNEKAPGAFNSDQLIDNMVTTSEDDFGRQSSGTDAEYKLGTPAPDVPTDKFCNDITYLAAFGNSTMAEIARLSAQVLSKMKTDFISSISHELRSPLHGVLASVEFLQDTQMTEIQADMVSNIHASGKVLLDTINHVLDFSKVNRKTKNKKRIPKRKLKKLERRESVDDGSEEKADICILSEEVIESIYAGQGVSKKALGLAGHRRHASVGNSDAAVTVIVDIQWRPNWTFEIDAGAWRRIIMNLFSNSMKYTKAGFVNITIEVEEDVASHSRKSRANLLLKIKDSGKGISQEFLKHQLYKPFTQEDNLATGAGLGLSIVKAIIQDLGGRIEFQSEPGCGTEATVRIPLTERMPKPDSLKVVSEVRERVQGLKFRLESFDQYPDITETPTGILSAEFEAAMMLKSTVQDTLVDWFGMENASCTTPEAPVADVVVVMESGMGEKCLDEILQAHYDAHPKKEEKSVAIVLTTFCMMSNGLSSETSTISPLQSEPVTPIVTSAPEFPLSPPPTSATLDFAHRPALKDIQIQFKEHTTIEPDAPIQVQSTGQENGLPISSTNGTTPEAEKGLRVLLVEDNEINLKLLIATMRKLKLDHATAVNGLEAFNSYKDCDGKFDVIFMDISMPIMSGIESTRHIRRFEKENGLQPVALIALTGAANPSTRQEAFSSGVDLFLTKPVPMKALRGMLDDLKREGRGIFAGM